MYLRNYPGVGDTETFYKCVSQLELETFLKIFEGKEIKRKNEKKK